MSEVHEAVQRFDAAFEALEQMPETAEKERVFQLLESLDAIHRPGITALVERLRAASPDALYRALEDPDISLLLDMYGLSTQAGLDQAMAVLSPVVPYIESHGGSLRVLDYEDGVVTVQLAGTCSGCPASSATLRNIVERTLRQNMRGFQELRVAQAEPARPAGGTLLPMLGTTPPILWHDLGPASDFEFGQSFGLVLDGWPVLVAIAGGEAQAFENRCPESGQPLDGVRLSDGAILVSPWSNTAYDLRTGRAVDGASHSLRRLPAHLRDGRLMVGTVPKVAAA